MKKQTKIWLIAATLLIVLGLMLFVAVMTANHWDFSKINMVNYQTNTYIIDKEFHNIEIKTDTADIFFVLSEDGLCKVVCHEKETTLYDVSVQDETLIVKVTTSKDWFQFGISSESPKITVYLPENEYSSLLIRENTGDIEIPKEFQFQNIDITTSTGDIRNYASASEDIKIKTDTGDILTENISAKNLTLSVSTGQINVASIICKEVIEINVSTGKSQLSDASCKNLISKGSSGDVFLSNLLASEKFFIERNTGDVNFNDCDANEIYIKTSTGDVQGTFLSDKSFDATTDTGKVSVPKGTDGGKCEIVTDTGDITINIR